MDTVEELNGTYFYKGVCNISAGELFFWIFLDKIDEQFGGIKDVVTMSCIILGLPLLKARGKPYGATQGTSIASKYSREFLNVTLSVRLPTITNASIKYLKPMMTNNLGGSLYYVPESLYGAAHIEEHFEKQHAYTQSMFGGEDVFNL